MTESVIPDGTLVLISDVTVLSFKGGHMPQDKGGHMPQTKVGHSTFFKLSLFACQNFFI